MAKDNRETDRSHESTWGATDKAKKDWAVKNPAPKDKAVDKA